MACSGCGGNTPAQTIVGEPVLLSYLGSNTGPITYEGYLNRKYRVSRGDVVKVSPDDVQKLTRTGQFIPTPAQAETVEQPAPKQEEAKAAYVAPVVVDATPSALEYAEEHGIDLTTVSGSGLNGRVTLSDVKAHG